MFGIVDTDSGIILALTENITLANMLMEIPPDTFLISKINTVSGYEPIKNGEPHHEFYYSRYPERVIGKVDSARASLRPNARNIAELYKIKITAAFKVMDILRYHRIKHSSSFEYHGVVLEEKARQARDILARNQANELEHFYVTAYAKLKNMSNFEAAKLIKLKNDMFHQEMCLNETLRIKYFDIIKHASNAEQINEAFRQFHKETLFNQHADKDVV